MTQIVEISDPADRSRIAEAVLRDLPDWFGIEESTRQYIEDAAGLPTFVAEPDLGFVSLKQHTPAAAELYVLGVRAAQHRQGIGRALVETAESWCRERGIRYLHVKTLGPSRPDPGYDATRAFYEALGFVALEELHGLWDEENPTLVLVKDVRPGFTVSPVEGLPELREGDDLAALIAERAVLADGDVVVVAQKAVSKVEGQVVALADVKPSEQAREIASDEADARRIQVILDEAVELVRVRPPLIIARTAPRLRLRLRRASTRRMRRSPRPSSCSRSTRTLRRPGCGSGCASCTSADVGVIVTDSFGRPWRAATTDVAIGAAGVEVVRDLAGERDQNGYELHATRIALADEIAGAAQLVFGKLDRVPVAVVRGLDVRGDGRGADLVIPPETDLFR